MTEINCEGCADTDNEQKCKKRNLDGSCPCQNCIVKMMCCNICIEWTEWFILND